MKICQTKTEQDPTATDAGEDSNNRTKAVADAEEWDDANDRTRIRAEEHKMPRPRACPRIGTNAAATYYKPAGIPMRQLEEVTLGIDEIEALRRCDLDDVDQMSAGQSMEVSQPTVNRILRSARKKIADAIINGKAIRIEARQQHTMATR